MAEDKQVRIDKWLWSVRIYKTRNQATDACKKGKVLIKNLPVKASRIVTVGDIIDVKKNPVRYSIRVKALLSHRLSAKLAGEYAEDITSREELDKLMVKDNFYISREKGLGRPTKKERRSIDKIQGGI